MPMCSDRGALDHTPLVSDPRATVDQILFGWWINLNTAAGLILKWHVSMCSIIMCGSDSATNSSSGLQPTNIN